MADFLKAIDFVLGNEGEFSDNKNDHGGATKWGVSLRFLKSLPAYSLKNYGFFAEEITINTIQDMTRHQAIEIYRGEFWQHAHFDQILDQDVGNYIFDMCVNSGISPAIKCVQRAIWSIFKDRKKIKEDGILGAETIRLINNFSAEDILPAIRCERAGDYREIVAHEPTQKIFINGWLARAYER